MNSNEALTGHSPIGASGMYIWSECYKSPSFIKENGIVGSTSFYAAEGTVAHKIAAHALTHPDSNLHELKGKELFEEGHTIKVEQEMLNAIDGYLKLIRDMRDSAPNAQMFVEHVFHLETIHPELYGTADCVLLFPKQKKLIVIDLKYGSGHFVEVKGNKQLRYYGLGALLTIAKDLKIKTIELMIVQPRYFAKETARREVLTRLDMIEFQAELTEHVKRTEDPNAQFNPGKHCEWCPAATGRVRTGGMAPCPALRAKTQEIARKEFSSLVPYNPHELAETLNWFSAIERWISSTREFAYAEASKGNFRSEHGWKLVDKRPTRQWKDEQLVINALEYWGLSESQLYERKLKSPKKLEDEFGKNSLPDSLEGLILKKSSGTTLVPVTDKRPEVPHAPRLDAKTEFDIP